MNVLSLGVTLTTSRQKVHILDMVYVCEREIFNLLQNKMAGIAGSTSPLMAA